MNLIQGKSARGTTRIVTGPCYYISFSSSCNAWIEPVMGRPLPASLAWTEMNTTWNKKRGRK